MSNPSAGEPKHQERVVLALGPIAMDEGGAPREHLEDPVLLSEKVPRRFDTMAPEIEHGSSPCQGSVPEVRTVRTAVRFAGSDPDDFSDPAVLDRLSCLDHCGREYFRLCIAVHGAGCHCRIAQLPSFIPISAQRLRAHLVLTRSSQL